MKKDILAQTWIKSSKDEANRVLGLLGAPGEVIKEQILAAHEKEQPFLNFLYATMPLSDAVNYSFAIILDYARHGLYLWQNSPSAENLPIDLFLYYVLSHRINTEEISACRSFFYKQLAPLLSGKTGKEAVLAINDWCAENVTYRSTDDRTLSPMAIFKSGFGRCGEESTLVVSALRSMGIPARQIYAPRWSHCDDNHAWVEVWCEGDWHFIGACEPETDLDRGWFVRAASRAMLIHSRLWPGFSSPHLTGDEIIIQKEDEALLLNQLPRYAHASTLDVQVCDPYGQPVEGATVVMEVINYAAFCPIASLQTDEQGKVRFITNRGSLHLHVYKDGIHCFCNLELKADLEQVILLEEALQKDCWLDIDMKAPAESTTRVTDLSPEEKLATRSKRQSITSSRGKKVQDTTAQIRDVDGEFTGEMVKILEESYGNREVLSGFLQTAPEASNNVTNQLLTVLTPKDWRDVKGEVLQEHADYSAPYQGLFPQDIFVEYVLNPRVYIEPLTNYRKYILEYFSPAEQDRLRANPQEIWTLILERIRIQPLKDCLDLITVPVACLRSQYADELSGKILYVAIARTLGIPARLNPVHLTMEYYCQGTFCPVRLEDAVTAGLLLQNKNFALGDKPDNQDRSGLVPWSYRQNWSLSRWEGESYSLCHLPDSVPLVDSLALDLIPGSYRLVTANRLPNGNVLSRHCDFDLDSNSIKTLDLQLRQGNLEDLLQSIPLPDFDLQDETGSRLPIQIISGGGKLILLWLAPGEEPTEHILNELIEHQEAFSSWQNQIVFVVPGGMMPETDTWKKTLALLPGIRIFHEDEGETRQLLARKMYQDSDSLPFLLLLNQKAQGVYASCGYNVGVAYMILKLIGA